MPFPPLRLVLLGNVGLGKSALVLRFVEDRFDDEYDPTIEEFFKRQCVVDGETAHLEILDAAVQEGWYSVRKWWITYGEGFILVYSITDRQSFEQIPRLHNEILQMKGTTDSHNPCSIVIVGTKCDLNTKREVTIDEGQELARRLECAFIETSAKENYQVDEAFTTIVRQIRGLQRNDQTGRASIRSSSLDNDEEARAIFSCSCVLA